MPVLEDARRGQAEEGFSPHNSAHLDTADGPEGSTAVDDGVTQERETKVPKLSPQGSPSSASGQLYSPHFAGNIQHVREIGEVDDEEWEQEVADYFLSQTGSISQEMMTLRQSNVMKATLLWSV